MQYNNGFDIKGFEEYMNECFSLDEFSQSMIDNLANFAVENQNHSKDQLADFLSNVIPEVEFKVIAGFCEDAILTESYGQEQKREFQAVQEFFENSVYENSDWLESLER